MSAPHRNQASARADWKPRPEQNSGISLTVPDQVLSIKELLRRHAGIPPVERNMIYDEEGLMPDPRSLDLVDIQELKADARKTTDDFRRARSRKNTPDNPGNVPKTKKTPDTSDDSPKSPVEPESEQDS